jgi:hypothetical protein
MKCIVLLLGFLEGISLEPELVYLFPINLYYFNSEYYMEHVFSCTILQ